VTCTLKVPEYGAQVYPLLHDVQSWPILKENPFNGTEETQDGKGIRAGGTTRREGPKSGLLGCDVVL